MRPSALVLILAACGSPNSSMNSIDASDSSHDASAIDSAIAIDAKTMVDAKPPSDAAVPDATLFLDAAPGAVDWTQIAASCGTLRDVAYVSDNEVFLACSATGFVRVTPTGTTAWMPPSGYVHKIAIGDGEVRALSCNTIYRYSAGTWVSEGTVGTLSSCSMGFRGGSGGWFVGTRSFGGNGGFWMKNGASWVVGVDTVRGFEDFVSLGPTEFLANTIGVSTGLNHMRKVNTSWSSVSDFSFAVRSLWRAPSGTVYFANTPGNGPGGGTGGIYRWIADAYTFEWDTPGFERINAIWGRSSTEIYAAGDSGTLVTSTGNGTWTAMTSGATADLTFIWSWQGHLVVASSTTIRVVN
jgi:hypothetical protein